LRRTVSGQNFHYVTSAESNSDSVNLRLIHNLGASSGPGFGLFGGGGGGSGGGRRSQNNINFGTELVAQFEQHRESFPSLAGGTGTQGLNASAGWT